MKMNLLQDDISNRGLVLDPRTKMILLITMTFFVLGYAGGEDLAFLMPVYCIIPAILFVLGKKCKIAVIYVFIYSLADFILCSFNGNTIGLIYFLLFGSCSIITRILPCMMIGAYTMSTTTVSEFTAAMLKMHVSEKIIIPLSVMFRFFPTIVDEYRNINAAMRMRDIRFGGKNALKMVEYRVVPLMTSCAKIGEELSAAALTRGLCGEIKRTNICKIGFRCIDVVIIILCIIPYILWIMVIAGNF